MQHRVHASTVSGCSGHLLTSTVQPAVEKDISDSEAVLASGAPNSEWQHGRVLPMLLSFAASSSAGQWEPHDYKIPVPIPTVLPWSLSQSPQCHCGLCPHPHCVTTTCIPITTVLLQFTHCPHPHTCH